MVHLSLSNEAYVNALSKMKEAVARIENGDEDGAHSLADEALLNFITALGSSTEVRMMVTLYESIQPKWYS